MKKTNFESLRIYRLAEAMADGIWSTVARWNNFEKYSLGAQLVRSADSVGANIAEGAGRYGTADNKRFAYIARGSLNETKHWLRRAYKRSLLTRDEVESLRVILDELSPKLNAYINSLKGPPSAGGSK